MGFKMIYWTPISDSYFLKGSIYEKCGIFWKKQRIWPDWGNTARADMAGLGSNYHRATHNKHDLLHNDSNVDKYDIISMNPY